MAERIFRVVIDTSVWISAFLNPGGPPGQVIAALRARRFIPIISPQLVAEIRAVAARPRISQRRRLSESDVTTALDVLEAEGQWVQPAGTLRVCRDPKDNIILETAIEGIADFLVSRDEDLTRDLNLIRYLRAYGVEAVTIAQFLRRLEQDPS